MNPKQTIQHWRATERLKALADQGWNVVFARTAEGTMPALDYLDGTDEASDPQYGVAEGQHRRLQAQLHQVGWVGPRGLNVNQLTIFKGDDAEDGMCELRIVAFQGHRILGFLRPNKTLVLTNGFRKQSGETPPEQKRRAREVLRSHEGRIARLQVITSPNSRKSKK
ncbi:MAG: type II toxin-antitoxin system RelE/ParE family toxin [Planctomycetes bacterium]|nr:type II toxin-antitoxin system RelE/ParE family toxin [Planctomycetota bacterium]